VNLSLVVSVVAMTIAMYRQVLCITRHAVVCRGRLSPPQSIVRI
jgi:hypothetical protein